MKGEKGERTHVIIQPIKWVPLEDINIDWTKLSHRSRRFFKLFKGRWHFMKNYKVKTDLINNEEKMAAFVYNLFGFGKYGVMFRARFAMSKHYNPNFICTSRIRKRCSYYLAGRCHRMEKIKIGMSCVKNKKRVRAFFKKAEFTIKEPNQSGIDFIYDFNDEKTSMHTFWFWKGKQKHKIKRQVQEQQQLAEEQLPERLKGMEK